MGRKTRNLAQVSLADRLTEAEDALVFIYQRSLGPEMGKGFDIRTRCMAVLNRRPKRKS